MAVLESSGTQSALVDTDHILASPSTSKTRVLTLDLSALTNLATVDVTISMPVLSGGTSRIFQKSTYSGFSVSAEPIVQSFPVEMLYGGSFSLRSSVAISIPWRIVTLD